MCCYSVYCKCSVALPQGAMGWSAVCDVAFPDHTHLLWGQGHKMLPKMLPSTLNHHDIVTYATAKFEVAIMSYGLGGDAFTRKFII